MIFIKDSGYEYQHKPWQEKKNIKKEKKNSFKILKPKAKGYEYKHRILAGISCSLLMPMVRTKNVSISSYTGKQGLRAIETYYSKTNFI